jgi:hypothetical protein
MKPIELTNKELDEIMDKATRSFATAEAKRQRNFLAECVVLAFIDHCAVNDYTVQNGKIYTHKD